MVLESYARIVHKRHMALNNGGNHGYGCTSAVSEHYGV
jgi:hypothetical protein